MKYISVKCIYYILYNKIYSINSVINTVRSTVYLIILDITNLSRGIKLHVRVYSINTRYAVCIAAPPSTSTQERLDSAHFRHLNEQLYTQTGDESLEMFCQEPEKYEAYHRGYSAQVCEWPLNPVDKAIEFIRKKSVTMALRTWRILTSLLGTSLQSLGVLYGGDFVTLFASGRDFLIRIVVLSDHVKFRVQRIIFYILLYSGHL